MHRLERNPNRVLAWVKEHILRLHDWRDEGGFIAEGGAFTRQSCMKCPKTRVTRFFR